MLINDSYGAIDPGNSGDFCKSDYLQIHTEKTIVSGRLYIYSLSYMRELGASTAVSLMYGHHLDQL